MAFFLDILGFFLKALGKYWKWSDSSRNAKKKISLLWGGGTLYCTVLYCTKLYSTLSKFGLQIFFLPFLDELGHIHLFLCVFGRLKKTQRFGKFPNFRGEQSPESLENSKLFLVFFIEGFPY